MGFYFGFSFADAPKIWAFFFSISELSSILSLD